MLMQLGVAKCRIPFWVTVNLTSDLSSKIIVPTLFEVEILTLGRDVLTTVSWSL